MARMPPKWSNEIQYLFCLFEALCFLQVCRLVHVEEIHEKTSQLDMLDVENGRYTGCRSLS